jgi:hypothetical protein
MFKTELGPTAQLAPDILANYDLSRFCGFLDPRCRVNPVTVQIAIGGYCHISQMNADSQMFHATDGVGSLNIAVA